MKTENVVCFKYVFQVKQKEAEKPTVCVKFITDVESGHDKVIAAIKKDSNIVACYREYCHEVVLSKMLNNEKIKEKEENENEKKSSKSK